LCLYAGKQIPHPYTADLYDRFANPKLAKEYMFKPLSLIDLRQILEEKITKHDTGRFSRALAQAK